MIKKFFSLMRGDSGKPAAPAKKAATPARSAAATKPAAARSPEAVCGIDPKKMSPDEIRKRLAELFRRHNAAEASLNPELREEARVMLDAIVICRQKYVDGAK
ncbi:MAG: hypothetical protein JNK37_07065 [Verrucomicrobiales bacterium]|nr:hypothetical protein [Verrucomicrobiales bacterium]